MADNLGKKSLDILGFGDRPVPSFGEIVVVIGNIALDLLL